MKKITLSLLLGLFLLTAQEVFSQTLTNTDNTITLDQTCINNKITSGTYTLTLTFDDPDNGYTAPPATTCTVTSNGVDHLVITVSGLTFPTPSSNGYWYLADSFLG